MLVFVGSVIVLLGIIIWAAKAISIVSMCSYVKEENKKAFARLNGISTIGIGFAIISVGLAYVYLFFVFFIVSLLLYGIAQALYNNKYN